LGKVEPGFFQDCHTEASQLRDVWCEPAERHRLGVRSEIAFTGRDPCKRLARLVHFGIEFRQEEVADSHRPRMYLKGSLIRDAGGESEAVIALRSRTVGHDDQRSSSGARFTRHNVREMA
jgi:hypothetical protein